MQPLCKFLEKIPRKLCGLSMRMTNSCVCLPRALRPESEQALEYAEVSQEKGTGTLDCQQKMKIPMNDYTEVHDLVMTSKWDIIHLVLPSNDPTRITSIISGVFTQF